MKNTPISLPIYVSTSDTLKGIRCIRAAQDIKEGELIESCPIILLPTAEFEFYNKTVLTNYDYDWDEKNGAFVLGYCVLTNHSFSANARYVCNLENKTMDYFAVKDIKKDEEVFINYNGKPNDETPLEHQDHVNFKH